MILVIDAGNSRVKWGVHDGQKWLRQGWSVNRDVAALAESWQTIGMPDRIVASNVAGEAVRIALEDALSRFNKPIQWVAAMPSQCGVRNGYTQPAQLGSDRWAALIGAWRLHQEACVVVNVGTAMTVDALSDQGEFIGGLIVPGLAAMEESLERKAAGIERGEGLIQTFPTNTADAVRSGVAFALAGAVGHMVDALSSKLGRTPVCILSGGDAELLRPLLPVETRVQENLVLEGLIGIALA